MHAAGHFAYAKSAHIYLQDMQGLKETMDPSEFHKFTTKGYFTIHRSNKACSGVATDMAIEQTLNRSFGTDLRHGRGVTPSVISRYLLAMPSTFEVIDGLETYLGIKTSNSEQHVDTYESRVKIDNYDLQQFSFWFREHNLFEPRPNLISLSTGIIGGPTINCHMAIEISSRVINAIIGESIGKTSLTKLFKVNTIDAA